MKVQKNSIYLSAIMAQKSTAENNLWLFKINLFIYLSNVFILGLRNFFILFLGSLLGFLTDQEVKIYSKYK